jgi:hypothetical protein
MIRTAAPISARLLGLSLSLALACASEEGVRDGSLPAPVAGNGPVGPGRPDAGTDAGAQAGADAGDAGVDAGHDGGNAGAADAGPCVGSLSRPTLVAARDECFSGGASRFPSLIDNDCNAILLLDTVPTCSGHLGGPLNAFTGTCSAGTSGASPCTSASIPGTLRCLLPDAGAPCVIVLCDGSGDGGCTP